MWGAVDDRKEYLTKAIAFTGNHQLYGYWMNAVVDRWWFSCENALTDDALSKKAWIGHAACALAFGCPEDIVRLAWGSLTDEQQFLANEQAERAIQKWSNTYRTYRQLCNDMGEPLLP